MTSQTAESKLSASEYISNLLGKIILISLQNDNNKYIGKLISIDSSFNLLLVEANNTSNVNEKYEYLLIRGNNVLYISPFKA